MRTYCNDQAQQICRISLKAANSLATQRRRLAAEQGEENTVAVAERVDTLAVAVRADTVAVAVRADAVAVAVRADTVAVAVVEDTVAV